MNFVWRRKITSEQKTKGKQRCNGFIETEYSQRSTKIGRLEDWRMKTNKTNKKTNRRGSQENNVKIRIKISRTLWWGCEASGLNGLRNRITNWVLLLQIWTENRGFVNIKCENFGLLTLTDIPLVKFLCSHFPKCSRQPFINFLTIPVSNSSLLTRWIVSELYWAFLVPLQN